MEDKDYLKQFLWAISGSNNRLFAKRARLALELGLNKQEGFNFDNPRLLLAITSARDISAPLLMIEFGFDKKKMLDFAIKNNETVLAERVEEMLIKEEKEQLSSSIKKGNANKQSLNKI